MKISKIETYSLIVPDFDSDACSSAQDNFVVKILADNGLYGIGETVGSQLVNHSKINMISLTGDVATGSQILKSASNGVKRTHLELGGKAPVIIFPKTIGKSET